MIPAFGPAAWWPLTSQAGVFFADVGTVATAAMETVAEPSIGLRTDSFDRLEEAVATGAPHPYAAGQEIYLLGTMRDTTVVLSSAAPCTNLLYGLSGVVDRLGCAFVSAAWTPPARGGWASAGFVYRGAEPPAPGPRATSSRPARRQRDELTVLLDDAEGRWRFERFGSRTAFGFENTQTYRAEDPVGRLPFSLLVSYLAAVGIPVDDPDYLREPVVALTVGHRLDADYWWSTIEELRQLCGYGAQTIPGDLRAPAFIGSSPYQR